METTQNKNKYIATATLSKHRESTGMRNHLISRLPQDKTAKQANTDMFFGRSILQKRKSSLSE